MISLRRLPLIAWALAALCGAAGLYIAFDSLMAVIRGYSPLPFWDQWEPLRDYARLRAGTYRLSDLFAQHNEHRIVLPRLLFWVDYAVFGGSNRFNLALIYSVQLTHAALLIRLMGGPWRNPVTLAAAGAAIGLMLSLGQWENLVWGFQTQFVGVFALATGAFMLLRLAAAARNRRRTIAAFAGAVALLLLATLTMANGMAAMGVAALLALTLRARPWIPAVLLAMMAATLVAYFHAYQVQSDHSALAYALAHSPDYVRYVLSYMGTVVSSLQLEPGLWKSLSWAPPAVGAAGVASTLAAMILVWRDRDRDGQGAILVAVMLFILATAAATALGRLSFGLDQAYSPRYRTPCGVFWAATILFWARAALASPKAWPRAAVAGFCVVLAGWLLHVQAVNRPEADRHAKRMHEAEDSLLSGARDYEAFSFTYAYPDVLLHRANTLRTYGKSIFRRPETRWLGRPIGEIAKPRAGACIGAFDAVTRSATGEIDAVRVEGWAWNSADGKPVRRVLLTDERLRVVGFASTGADRPDVPVAVAQVSVPDSGWRGFAHARGGMLRAFVLLPGNTACEVGQKSSAGLPLGMAARRATPRWVGPVLQGPTVADPSWTARGAPPQVALPAGGGAFASWSGADSRTGAIRFGPFRPAAATVVVGLVTGPDVGGQSITLTDAGTGAVISRIQPPKVEAWTWTRLQLPPEAVGRTLVLTGADAGTGWGQWLGMTAPHLAVPRRVRE